MMISVKKVMYNVFLAIVAMFAVGGLVEAFDLEVFYDFADTSWFFMVAALIVIGIKAGYKWSNNNNKTTN